MVAIKKESREKPKSIGNCVVNMQDIAVHPTAKKGGER